jgi:O-antigen/teichoic acid export membrane protein
MQPLWGNVAALAVALIFYTWRSLDQLRQRRNRALRERVAYMLWIMATHGASKTREIPRAAV